MPIPPLGRFSNQPDRLDQDRVARLRPVRTAIDKLQLPPLRLRKLRGILSALEMQIEDGGDSPEVNRHLLEALRAGIRHQVHEERARAALAALVAIEAFEQAEARRWEQMNAGALLPDGRPPEARLDELIGQGYELFESRRLAEACDRWLEAWELVKQLARPEWRTTRAFDEAVRPHLHHELVYNWCQELEAELGNAAIGDPLYNEHRLRYVREFLAFFPEVGSDQHVNFMRAQGEALWNLGRRAEAEAVFGAMVDRFPDEAWGYIGWADQYWLLKNAPKEYDRAEAILKRALARPTLKDRVDLLERLEMMYGEWGRPEEQAAIAALLRQPAGRSAPIAPRAPTPTAPPKPAGAPPSPPPRPTGTPPPVLAPATKKPGRNGPCWCGSGKKYKLCHLRADEESARQ